jgi:hypothetical protein
MEKQTEMTTDLKPKWYWLRVYYFEDCKDRLIQEALWPGVQQILSENPGAQAYFERDWIGGPNVVAGVKCAPGNGALLTVRGVRFIQDYLMRHPSSTIITLAEFERRIKKLRVLEHRNPADIERGLLPNNTVVDGCEEPFSPLLSPGPLKEQVREFLCQSSSLVVSWLALVRECVWQKQHIALQVMIGLAWLANPQTLRSHASYVSHAGGFSRFLSSDGQLLRSFSNCYEGSAGQAMRRYLSAAVDALQQERSLLPGMNDYLALLREVMIDLYDGLAGGRYAAPPLKQIDRSRVNRASGPTAQISRRLNELMGTNIILQTWRLTINLVYRMLNQLGLSAYERCWACYLVSRAAEDVFRQPADTIAQELAHTGDANQMITFFQGVNLSNRLQSVERS